MEGWLEQVGEAHEWTKVLLFAASTLISEDLTTISAGILASQGTVHPITALVGCILGIFVGDGIIYLIGLFVGKPALKFPLIRRFLSEEKVDICAKWFEKNGLMVVLMSRFIPGTRVPTYFAAGILGARAKYFLPAAGLAVLIWTPLLMGAAWLFGDQIKEYLDPRKPYAWIALIASILLVFGAMKVMVKLADWRFRKRLYSRIYRFARWEFWPLGLLYIPIVAYNILLAMRYRRFFLPFISNPGIEFSGYIGESKTSILDAFPQNYAHLLPKYIRLERDQLQQRLATALEWMETQEVAFPLFIKPDVGQRGMGVKKLADEDQLKAYLKKVSIPLHLQELAPGPMELGIFYQRLPSAEK